MDDRPITDLPTARGSFSFGLATSLLAWSTQSSLGHRQDHLPHIFFVPS
jgi:hypothetical protein